MKKLFLILVSVLLLGGCSVDDDISASGGGVSNGGDDMSITTYPNVVEASRTVVEGGYLVDYVYSSLSSEDSFLYNLNELFKVFFDNKYQSVSDIVDFCIVSSLNNVFSRFRLRDFVVEGSTLYKLYFIDGSWIEVDKNKGVMSRSSAFSQSNLMFELGLFTIFEPSE